MIKNTAREIKKTVSVMIRSFFIMNFVMIYPRDVTAERITADRGTFKNRPAVHTGCRPKSERLLILNEPGVGSCVTQEAEFVAADETIAIVMNTVGYGIISLVGSQNTDDPGVVIV